MLLYLAGVNEHAVFRIVESKRWSVAHFPRTTPYFFANTQFPSFTTDANVRAVKPTSRKERNYFLFADDPLERLFLPGIEREAMLLGVQDVRASRERRISMVCSSFFGPIVRTGK